MSTHAPPVAPQRFHWRVYVRGAVPVQLPSEVVSCWPSCTTPDTLGNAAFTGRVSSLGSSSGAIAVVHAARAITTLRMPRSGQVRFTCPSSVLEGTDVVRDALWPCATVEVGKHL